MACSIWKPPSHRNHYFAVISVLTVIICKNGEHVKQEYKFIRENKPYLCSYHTLHSPTPKVSYMTIYISNNVSFNIKSSDFTATHF